MGFYTFLNYYKDYLYIFRHTSSLMVQYTYLSFIKEYRRPRKSVADWIEEERFLTQNSPKQDVHRCVLSGLDGCETRLLE